MSAMNVDETLSRLTRDDVTASIPALCFIALFMVVGAVGNFLVLLTYHNKLGHSSTNFFIFCLAIFDMSSCCASLPLQMYGLSNPFTYNHPALCKLHNFIAFTADLSSGLIIVCISFDRYFRIARPHHRGMSRKQSRTAMAVVVLSAVLISAPSLFVYGTETAVIQEEPDIVGHSCSVSDEAEKTVVPLIFNMIILLSFVVGTIVLLTVYAKLGLHVRHWSKHRPTSVRAKTGCRHLSEDSSSTKCESAEKMDSKERESYSHDFAFQQVPPLELNGEKSKVDHRFMSLDRQTSRHSDCKTTSNCYNTLPLPKPTKPQTQRTKPSIARRMSSAPSINTLRKKMTLSKTTVMFISATAAFILCHIPYVVIKLAIAVDPSLTEGMSVEEKSFFRLGVFSFAVAFAANPLIYSFMNPRFRRDCAAFLLSSVRRMDQARTVSIRVSSHR